MIGQEHPSPAEWCDDHAVSRAVCGCPSPGQRPGSGGSLCGHGLPADWPCADCESGPASDARGHERTDGQRSRLRAALLDRRGLANLPAPQPLIANTLDLRTLAMLAGYWGVGKSFLALDWAACIASGKPWQGRAVEAGRVLYVAAEGAYGLHRRLTAWEAGWKTKVPTDMFHVLPTAPLLGQRADVEAMRDIVADLTPVLVVVDTVARCAVGLDENSARDMGLFVRALDVIREATPRGTVLAVHHTGKDKATIRGSSAMEGAADTVYLIETEGGSSSLTLDRKKRKDGPRPDRMTLGIDPVPGTDSAVLSRVHCQVDTTSSARTLMSAFMSTFAVTGATKSDLRTVANMPSGSFYRAVNSCLEQGLLVNEGSDSRPFYKLGSTYA